MGLFTEIYEEETDLLGWGDEDVEEWRRSVKDYLSEYSLKANVVQLWCAMRKTYEKGLIQTGNAMRTEMWRVADIWVSKYNYKIWWNEKLGRFQDVETGRIVKTPEKAR